MKNKNYIMDFRPALIKAGKPLIEIPKELEEQIIKTNSKAKELLYLFGHNKHLMYDEEH